MNERINELSEQALESVSNKRMLKDGQLERTWNPHEYDQVFAELIVRECVEVAEFVEQNSSVEKVSSVLRRHLGVKE